MTGLVAAMTALLAYGIGTSTGAVTFNSLLQAETPEKLRGRVFAGFDMLWQSGRLLSLLAGGLLADTLGIRAVYYLGAAFLLAAAAAGWSGLRHSDDADSRAVPQPMSCGTRDAREPKVAGQIESSGPCP